jgi:hypothetical protein
VIKILTASKNLCNRFGSDFSNLITNEHTAPTKLIHKAWLATHIITFIIICL